MHLPPDLEWNACRVATCIASTGLQTRVDGDSVLADVPHLELLSWPKRIWLMVRSPQRYSIGLDRTKFLRNVSVDFDALRIPIPFPGFDCIYRGLKAYGCLTCNDRDIALNYFPESDELPTLFDTFDKLQREKENLVVGQDFVAAARLADEGDLIRIRVDVILTRHLGLGDLTNASG